jgi:hypothetical protein
VPQAPIIDEFEIPKALRGTGVGRATYKTLEDKLRAEGAKEIHLMSEPDTVGFWKKMGFKAHDPAEKGERVLMTKPVTPTAVRSSVVAEPETPKPAEPSKPLFRQPTKAKPSERAPINVLPSDTRTRPFFGSERGPLIERTEADIAAESARVARIQAKPPDIGTRLLSDAERTTIIESVGRDKATRFGRRVYELDDTELLQVASEERAAATRRNVTQNTPHAEPVIKPTPDAKLARRQQNLRAIQGIHQSLGIEDVAAQSGMTPEYVAGADPARLRAWLAKNRDTLVKQGVTNLQSNKALRTKRYATGANQKAVSAVLSKYGATPEDVAFALNIDFEAPATGTPGIEPIRAVPGKLLQPGDVYAMDAAALENNLARGQVGRSIRYLRSVQNDIATLSPELQARYPKTLEGAIQYLNDLRTPTTNLPPEAMEELALKRVRGQKAPFFERQEPEYAGLSPDTVEPPTGPTTIADTSVDPEKLYTVRYMTPDGEEAVANMYGDRLAQSAEAGQIKPSKIEEVPSPDNEHDEAFNTYLGSGFGGAQALYDKYITKKLAPYGPKVQAAWRDTRNKMTSKAFADMVLAFEMPTSFMHREPATMHAVDLAYNATNHVIAADNQFAKVINNGKDWVRLRTAYPEAAEEMIETIVAWNEQYKHTYQSVTQARRDRDMQGIFQKLDARGQKLAGDVYSQINAARELSGQTLREGILESAQFSRRTPEMQKRLLDVIDPKFRNPDYVHFSRRGNYSVSVTGDRGGKVHEERWASRGEAMKGLEELKKKFPQGRFRFEDRTSNVYETHSPTGKTGEGKLPPGTKRADRDEDLILERLDVDRLIPAAADETLENTIREMATEGTVGRAPSYLSRRQYVPGHKTTIETVFHDFERINDIGARLKASAMIRNNKEAVLEKVKAGLITRNPKKQQAFLDAMDKYLELGANPHTERQAFGMIRAGLANMELVGKLSFPLINMTQTLTMTLNAAAGYGMRGVARWAAAHKVASIYAMQRLVDPKIMIADFAAEKIHPDVTKALLKLSEEGQLGPAVIEDLASLTPKQRTRLEEFFQAGPFGKMVKAPYLGAKYGAKAMTALIAVSERYNRLVDAFTYLGIGHDMGYRGDDLFNFARRGIAKTQLRYEDMWLPNAMRESRAILDVAKTQKLFFRYSVEQFLHTSQAIEDSMRSVTKEGAKQLLRAVPERRTGPRVIRGRRAAVGKSRLRAPAAVLGQLALGGAMGLDPTVWAIAAITGAVGLPAATAYETWLRHHNAHPSTDKITKELAGPNVEDPTTGMTWDERASYWEKELGASGKTKDVVHFGIPSVIGINIGGATRMSTPYQTVTSPAYPGNRVRDAYEAIKEFHMTGNPVKLFPVFGSLGKGIDDAVQMMRDSRVTLERGNKKTALMDPSNENEPYNPEVIDYVAALGRFDTVSKAKLRNDIATRNLMQRRREQLNNSVMARVHSYIDNHADNIDYDAIDEMIEPMNVWNDLLDSKGLYDAAPSIAYDMRLITKRIDEYIEEVEFAEGVPRTPKQRVELAEARRRRPSAVDLLTSEGVE